MKKIRMVMLSVLSIAVGQILLKYGVNQVGGVSYSPSIIGQTLLTIVTNPAIVIGFILFGLSSLFWLLAISESELSYAYPLLGTGYAIVALLSWIIFNDAMSGLRIAGIAVITTGVVLLARS